MRQRTPMHGCTRITGRQPGRSRSRSFAPGANHLIAGIGEALERYASPLAAQAVAVLVGTLGDAALPVQTADGREPALRTARIDRGSRSLNRTAI